MTAGDQFGAASKASIKAAVSLLFLLQGVALAHSPDDLDRVVESRICPNPLNTYNSIQYDDYCGSLESNPSLDSIFSKNKCWNEVDRINNHIMTYNSFVVGCRQAFPDRPTNSSTVLSKLPKAYQKEEEQRQKAFDEMNMEAAEKQRLDQQEKVNEQKKQAERLNDDLARRLQDARAKSDNSAAVAKQFEGEMNSDMEHRQQKYDEQRAWEERQRQDQEAQLAADKAREDARRIEQDRTKRQLEAVGNWFCQTREGQAMPECRNKESRQSGWKCFPDYGSCTAYCREATDDSSGGWCEGICSPMGTGVRPKPVEFGDQRCYHPR